MSNVASPHVVDCQALAAERTAAGTCTRDVLPPTGRSPLSMQVTRLRKGSPLTLTARHADIALFVFDGVADGAVGSVSRLLPRGGAMFVVDGATATVSTESEATLFHFVIDGSADSHAPLGAPAVFAALDFSDTSAATCDREFQILFDASNGSRHATIFGGMVPPGAAPSHFHQYDEILVTLEGEGRFHFEDMVHPVSRGCAFRIPARHLHINENASDVEEMMVLGIFTPAGSPAAAYLPKAGQPHVV